MVEESKRWQNMGEQRRSSGKAVSKRLNCNATSQKDRVTQLSQHNLLGILPQLAIAEAAVPMESVAIMYQTYRFSEVLYSICILLSARSVVALHCQFFALHHSLIFCVL